MKLNELRKIIREEVKAAIQEELIQSEVILIAIRFLKIHTRNIFSIK